MPPKKQAEKVSKLVEEKTFGMKNKNKSAKVNKFVEQLKVQAMSAGNNKEKREMEEKKNYISKKQIEADKKADLALLFKTVQAVQKVPFGVDPKTILCQLFKNGSCPKSANKCKFSHDLDVERGTRKIDLYSDSRKQPTKNGKESDSMDTWDQEKLESVINKKFLENPNKPTDIVCKYFLEAIEAEKYGWFWTCPNGQMECKYRHALPPGYVLKKKETGEERLKREEKEKENAITIEDFLETERHNLGPNLTPITFETFTAWKKTRIAKQLDDEESQKKKKVEAYKKMKAGMKSGMTFSGKELFDFNPEWMTGGDDDGALEEYGRVESGDEEEINAGEIDKHDIGSGVETKAIQSNGLLVPELNEDELAGLDLDGDDSDEE